MVYNNFMEKCSLDLHLTMFDPFLVHFQSILGLSVGQNASQRGSAWAENTSLSSANGLQ